MLYLNDGSASSGKYIAPNLTLTSVVFECYTSSDSISKFFYLTLTSVVFEYKVTICTFTPPHYLTLTSVVFELDDRKFTIQTFNDLTLTSVVFEWAIVPILTRISKI